MKIKRRMAVGKSPLIPGTVALRQDGFGQHAALDSFNATGHEKAELVPCHGLC